MPIVPQLDPMPAPAPVWLLRTLLLLTFCLHLLFMNTLLGGSLVALVSAWISTNSGRLPSNTGTTAEPTVSPGRWERKALEGFSTSASPLPFISNIPISLVEPKRFLTLRSKR